MIPSAIIALFFLAAMTLLSPSPCAAADDEAIRQAAAERFKAWGDAPPLSSLDAYGFGNALEVQRAIVLQPLGVYQPDRTKDPLYVQSVEQAMAVAPLFWIVPVGVDGQIRCIVSVKANEDDTYEAFAVGDAFLANRLASGLAKLGLSADASFTSLRYVRFMSPNYDLLLSEKDGAWTWVNLLGTLEANAQILTRDQAGALLDNVSSTPPNQDIPPGD